MSQKKKNQHQPSSVRIREQLEEKDRELAFKDDLFGMTLLTNPGLISSSRNIMFTSHLRQIVGLKDPEIPKLFTNYENEVGKNSTSYYKAKANYEVVQKILHYRNVDANEQGYTVILYDRENDHYHLVYKKVLEDLTEKYGYEYNTDYIDSKDVGDTIDKGDVLYKSYSYDDDMNYRYGVNARFMYSIDNRTIEDAIVVSRSLAERMISKEIETFQVSVNDNDLFCNIYGKSGEYKCFPDIGDEVKDGLVCAIRRLNNSQLLYDLKQSNLREVDYSSDSCTFCDGRIADIKIYSNKPRIEIEENQFNRQIIQYLDYQDQYNMELLEACERIIESGSSYSKEVKYAMKRAKEYLDETVKWRKEDNSVFSNMIIEFTVERDVPLKVGQKITGGFAPLHSDVYRSLF